MKQRFIALLPILALLWLGACGGGADKESAANDQTVEATGWSGGEALSVDSETSLATLVGQPEGFVGQTVRLEGKVTGVCKGSGCWVEISDPEGHSFIAKSVDHSISFPKDCEGRQAVVQGVIISQPAPGAAEAPSEEPVESTAEGEPHECPAPIYMMELKGAELI
jgi:hypothetical protein